MPGRPLLYLFVSLLPAHFPVTRDESVDTLLESILSTKEEELLAKMLKHFKIKDVYFPVSKEEFDKAEAIKNGAPVKVKEEAPENTTRKRKRSKDPAPPTITEEDPGSESDEVMEIEAPAKAPPIVLTIDEPEIDDLEKFLSRIEEDKSS